MSDLAPEAPAADGGASGKDDGRSRLDLAVLKELSIQRLIEVAEALEIPGVEAGREREVRHCTGDWLTPCTTQAWRCRNVRQPARGGATGMGHRFKLGCSASFSRILSLVVVLLLQGARPAAAGSRPGALLPGGPDTFWLDFTNMALGLVTLEACLWVAWGIVQEAVLRRRLRRLGVTAGGLVLFVTIAFVPRPAGATVEMQNQAKKVGVDVRDYLYCHASPHSVEVMKKKAKDLSMADGNCLACRGADIPIKPIQLAPKPER